MRKALGKLRAEASRGAAWRGHRLEWMDSWHKQNRTIQRGVCLDCGMDVDCNTNPEANGIDIGGQAIALNCTHH